MAVSVEDRATERQARKNGSAVQKDLIIDARGVVNLRADGLRNTGAGLAPATFSM